ncbi:CAP domain-containing protein [Streptomyces sp. SP18CS02]|uniref:CAP domain-containing protein n=1 Tax=Streptomyces sp. SP18CS02 TaxID=3002531 RepID=UPI002E7757F6|nr:CAP domain-containing protein [Streptomyces sp. SP18CS02]MEE1756965.1 CAP domain-containing protein [Streptomyces sp. SP18CS02]
MGRHRRSGAVPAEEHAAGTDRGHRGGARRKKRALMPVRTGLLGASAAMAVGAVAVASGLLPGTDTYKMGGSTAGDQVRADGSPELQTQGETSATPTGRASASASRSAERAHAPSKTPTPTPTSTPAKPSSSPPKQTKAPEPAPAKTKTKTKSAAPTREVPAPVAPERTTARAEAPAATGREAAAEAAVLRLVNAERAKVGCSPLRASSSLASLAGSFSKDMAERGFFSHTDPDGATPWDRAQKAGVSGLGAENIARGQVDAEAVMDSWMNSEGHRANILNCDYTTLGVGVHFEEGGPWWTQDFGF